MTKYQYAKAMEELEREAQEIEEYKMRECLNYEDDGLLSSIANGPRLEWDDLLKKMETIGLKEVFQID